MLIFSFTSSIRKFLTLTAWVFLLCSCSEEGTPTTDPTLGTTVPEVYKKIYGASSITSDGTYITIKTKGLPDHKSPYYATTNTLYQAYSGTTFGGLNFNKNPNTIVEQSGTFKIPVNPKVAASHAATPLGPIGIALNGVPFFNQYAGPNNQELTGEMASFDQFYGHPQQSHPSIPDYLGLHTGSKNIAVTIGIGSQPGSGTCCSGVSPFTTASFVGNVGDVVYDGKTRRVITKIFREMNGTTLDLAQYY